MTSFRHIGLFSLVTLVGVFILSGCASRLDPDIDQNSIFTQYEVVYRETSDQTVARAWFNFGDGFGTKLELSDDASIRFNDIDMEWKRLLGKYEVIVDGFVSDGSFEYSAMTGETYVNTLPIKTIGFPTGIDTVNRFSIYTLNWIGDPLDDSETVVLNIDAENSSNDFTWIENEEGEDHVTLSVDEMLNVSDGPSIWNMFRRTSPTLQSAPNAGGTMTGIYEAAPIGVLME